MSRDGEVEEGGIKPLPPEIRSDMARGRRLAWWTIGLMTTVIVVMGFAAGSSQAMRTAWIEDLLSLIPAIVFLVAAHFEPKAPTRLFPFGYHRANSLSFLIAAVALGAVGASLLIESVMTLIKQEHATVGPMTLFGHDIWAGWMMVAALVYSIVPPVILGRLKLPVATRLQDKVLHTDAMMQKADWMTGLAGIAGVIGLGLGFWWADAAAAAIISLSILNDGIKALRSATAELVDGAPRALDKDAEAEDAASLRHELEARYPGAEVRLRETGRFIHAEVAGAERPDRVVDLKALWPGPPERAWRLAQLSFVARDERGPGAPGDFGS
ncbi:cation diffusion facilitator family transporter [Allosphingosinicella deserti]|uniref:Cobalt transporter n=1 Tax=Allosphingosinicella deserti TaxID=2116704 RepID=A0A2P7QM42_9SPHN|nr:cation diffusion facilitator family transporter [Sphingomonas deserti]PSJ39025.1 cobalt transporter [Sphingomonas deserti]